MVGVLGSHHRTPDLVMEEVLSSIQMFIVTGSTSDDPITVTGLKATAKVFACFGIDGTGDTVVDHTADVIITAADTIEITAVTSPERVVLLVFNLAREL